MSAKNSNRMSTDALREMAQSRVVPVEEPSSRFGFVFALLAILVPAGSVYAWRSGKLDAALTDFRRSGSLAETFGLAAKPARAPEPVAVAPQKPAPPPSQGDMAQASNNGKNHVYTVDDYLYGRASQRFTDHAFGGGVGLMAAGMTMSHLQEIRDPVDIKLLRDEKTDGIKEGQLRISCNRRAERLYRESSAPDAGLLAISAYGEEVLCLLTTRPERLCDSSEREYLSRRFRNYTVQIVDSGRLRDRAIEKANVTEKERAVRAKTDLNAALQRGVHAGIRAELAKLSTTGLIKAHDFAATPPNVILLNAAQNGSSTARPCKA